MHVVVTGAAGRLARSVLPRLCAHASIERVTGIDRVAGAYRHPKFAHRVADIADRTAHETLRDADALVNLAFVLLRGRMPLSAMTATNVDATKALLSAAADAGIASIVHLSSAAVYGHGADLAEDAPLAPLPRFAYARHKADVDRFVAATLPQVAVLRPAIVLGRNAQPLLKTLLALPFYVRVPDPQPRLCTVHEDDVAAAALLALDRRARGPFNLAAASTFSLRDVVRARHPHAPGVPLALAHAALRLAWRTTGFGGEPGWLDGARASLTLDCTRARSALGWRPRYDDWSAIIASCN
ncbi:MAG: NAD-dependent epimerase/dehydratase family protein [Rudaea sp.]